MITVAASGLAHQLAAYCWMVRLTQLTKPRRDPEPVCRVLEFPVSWLDPLRPQYLDDTRHTYITCMSSSQQLQ
jgi:hypothetical protein